MSSEQGVLLIELLVAAVMLAVIVITISMLAPRIAKSGLTTNLRARGAEILATKLGELQAQPYAIIRTSYDTPGVGPGPWFAQTTPETNPGTCDCRTADFTLLPSSDTVVADGHVFRRAWCIGAVTYSAGATQAYCAPPSDDNKSIWVWVSWELGSDVTTVSRDAIVTRF